MGATKKSERVAQIANSDFALPCRRHAAARIVVGGGGARPDLVRLRAGSGAAGGRRTAIRHRHAAGQARGHRLGRIHRTVRGGGRGAEFGPGSAASSPASDFRTAPSSTPATSVFDRFPPLRGHRRTGGRPALRRARQGRTCQARTRSRSDLEPEPGGLGRDRRSAPSDLAGCQRRHHAGRGRAQGGPAQHRIHPRAGPDRRQGGPPPHQRRQSRAGQRRRRHAVDVDRLARSDLHLFRHGRGDLPQEQPAVFRRQAAELARDAKPGAGDVDGRNQAVSPRHDEFPR